MEIPNLKLPYSEEDIAFIKDGIEQVLRSGYLTMGRKVQAFEKQFASFCGVKFAIGTNSGTSSLEIILRAIDVENKTVVVPSNTYIATPLAAIRSGAKVIFTECERKNLQMDPEDLKRKLRDDTKAVIIVHVGGIISSRLDEIKKICDDRNIPLVEDAAHAHGAEYNQIKAGNLGLAGSFSFYPTKVLTTAEGGIITTNDETLYKKAIIIREHGKADPKINIYTQLGDNGRFSEIHAVLGLQQMKRVKNILRERRRLAKLYDYLLEGNDKVNSVFIPPNVQPSYYKYILLLSDNVDRQTLKKQLLKKFNITLPGEVYSDPCHSQPVFKIHHNKIIKDQDNQFSNTNMICRQHICLPLYPGLMDQEVEYTVESLNQVLSCNI